MLRLRRDMILASAAIVVGALAFGPHLYDVSRPFPDAIAARGGTWRTVLDSTGTPYRVVVHHIPQYCYSPGIGAVSEVSPGSADSLFRTANTIAAALRPDAERARDLYITVSLQLGIGYRWPWSERQIASYAWYRSSGSRNWKFLSFAGPAAARPALLDSVRSRRRAA